MVMLFCAFKKKKIIIEIIANEEYPTLLHFAARYGLEKLAMQLLDCPGGDIACDIRNSCDLTPAEIAQNSGHGELAHILSGYMVNAKSIKNAFALQVIILENERI